MNKIIIESKDGRHEILTRANTDNGIFKALRKEHEVIIDACKLYCGSLTPGTISVYNEEGDKFCIGTYICDVFGGRSNIELKFARQGKYFY